MIVTTKQLFQHAYGKYAVGAYNINNLEQTVGLFRGNLGKTKSNDDPVDPGASAPFIIQISRGARGYTDKRFLEAMIRTADEVFPEVIFAVHLDHGTEEVCYDCIDSGFYSSVMIDASHEAFDEEHRDHPAGRRPGPRQGASRSRPNWAARRRRGGHLGRAGNVCLTDPDQAAEFVERSGCDSLAVAIGTSHGAYKFTGKQGLHFDRSPRSRRLLPRLPAGDARLEQRAQGMGRRGSTTPAARWARQRRARGSIPAGRQAGRVQGEHRHRRPAGLVRRSTARRSATTRPISICVRQERSSWPPTPTTSSTRTRSSARPANWKRFARRWPGSPSDRHR